MGAPAFGRCFLFLTFNLLPCPSSNMLMVPSLHLVPNTPPASPLHGKETSGTTQHMMNGEYYDRKSYDLLADPELGRTSTSSRGHFEHDRHVHYPADASNHSHGDRDLAPSRASMDYRAPSEPIPKTQYQILSALAVGAPLIASVVSSCTSVIAADFASVMANDPIARPAKASVAVTLLWCALITSLGSTMTAVAGLALHAGYHDSHVGVTKRIVRFLRQWRDDRKAAKRGQHLAAHDTHVRSSIHLEIRPVSPVLSAVTDGHKEQHLVASFRAAVVSARLLGLSVALLAVGIAVYLFLLYPVSVAATTLVVGIVTAAAAAAPILPILMPHRH
ncbi:hypothetical protein FPV67DRAFT_1475769 [Lyophyllum atratum]|nr:hypothetical protein FPV67DRAFT_1475769 [Lyophyllum atratum]